MSSPRERVAGTAFSPAERGQHGRRPPAASFAEEFARAFDLKGRSLSWLRAKLERQGRSISAATLSYWRSGQRHPEGEYSLAVVAMIEVVLELPQGTLTQHLVGQSRRLGAVSSRSWIKDRTESEQELLEELGLPWPDGIRILSVQEVVDIDLRGSVSAVSTILLLQSVTASVDAFALLFDPKVGWNTDASLNVLAGGREDRAHMHPNGLWGYRVELDETLHKGQTGMVEYRVTHLRQPSFRTEYATVVRHPVREITQSFRFDERWIPDWAMEIQSGEKTRVESLVTGTSSLHRYRSSFGPGVLRVRWGRGDEVSS